MNTLSDDPIDHIIAIILALTTCLIRNLKQCLIPMPSKPGTIPRPVPSVTGSSSTTSRKSGAKKSGASTSTKPGSRTAAPKKVAGGTKRATRKPATTSSRRSRQSNGQSNSPKSTTLPTNQTSTTFSPKLQSTSDSVNKQQQPIPLPVLITNDYFIS